MSLMGKPLEKINDPEIPVLKERLQDTFYELDNLVEVHKAKKENPKNEIITFNIRTLDGETSKKQLIILHETQTEVEKLKKELLTLLAQNKDKNIVRAALVKAMQKKM